MNIMKASSPQNQIEKIIHLETDMTFLAKKVIGTANITTIKVNGLLKLDLCS
jgi:hypothetical protein